jgi:glycosyltransferase involved in cell wall biosynthesis
VKGVQAYRDFILVSDFCTAPTDFLAERIRSLGTRAYRVRNTLDDGAIAKFASVARAAPRPDFVIGYYSGSKTHQADFRNAGSALAEFMHENPPVVFRLVGNFDLEEYPEFQRFSESDSRKSRVTTVEPMPHSKMLEDQLECDVIIAPLEVGNPFCEAKSELKFFEASLVRRPVIASPTETLRKATRDGTFALLADQPSEWLAAFRRCIEDAEQLAAVADRAHDYVVNEYSPSAAGADAIEAYGDLFPQLSDSPFAQRSD